MTHLYTPKSSPSLTWTSKMNPPSKTVPSSRNITSQWVSKALSNTRNQLTPPAIENITISELIAMDNTYLPRIAHRQHLLRTQYNSVLACNPISTPAVLELYAWLTTTYLPTRFPTLYTLHPTTLLNRLTNAHIPLRPASAPAALETLCANIDTDFLILLPSSDPKDEGRYRLQAFITCFPSGFHTRKKLGLLLAEIHGPVPGYKAKLERSMDRFFAALPVGRVVRRLNWSVTTGRDLYCPEGNHLYGEDGAEAGQEEEVVDLQNTVMRSERQTLHRLPETRALVFAFKTYQYELSEVKEEGNGEALAQAIEGLGEGNVPGMRIYKKSVVWGDKVTEYLRS